MLIIIEKFYLADLDYRNWLGYLAPYKRTKYHLPEFRADPRPSGNMEIFNDLHSSFRNVIERLFVVLSLLYLPSYTMLKQSKIIHTCMALHNFIQVADEEFDRCDEDENYMPMPSSGGGASQLRDEDGSMNAFHDNLLMLYFLGVVWL